MPVLNAGNEGSAAGCRQWQLPTFGSSRPQGLGSVLCRLPGVIEPSTIMRHHQLTTITLSAHDRIPETQYARAD